MVNLTIRRMEDGSFASESQSRGYLVTGLHPSQEGRSAGLPLSQNRQAASMQAPTAVDRYVPDKITTFLAIQVSRGPHSPLVTYNVLFSLGACTRVLHACHHA